MTEPQQRESQHESQHEPQHEPQEQYVGSATVVADDLRIEVEADLRGHFEPIDGRFHWYGRLVADPALDALVSGSAVTLQTAHGSAVGRLSDVDPWGRPRLTGVGRPPF